MPKQFSPDRLRSLRKSRQVTREQLAVWSGNSYGAIVKWENGVAAPPPNRINQLASIFEVSADALMINVEPE